MRIIRVDGQCLEAARLGEFGARGCDELVDAIVEFRVGIESFNVPRLGKKRKIYISAFCASISLLMPKDNLHICLDIAVCICRLRVGHGLYDGVRIPL